MRERHPLLVHPKFRDWFTLPAFQLARLERICHLVRKSRRLVTDHAAEENRANRERFMRQVYRHLRPRVSLRRLYCLVLLSVNHNHTLPEDLLRAVLWFTG